MHVDEAKKLIAGGEGQRVEFKTSFAESREAIESLCALANADGGVVFFGVRDDGTIVGAQMGKKTLEDFSNQVKHNTQPNLLPEIYKLDIDGKTVVVVRASPAPPGTVYYAYNVPWCRSGKTNQLMTNDRLQTKLMATFAPDAVSTRRRGHKGGQSWEAREKEREELYRRNRGLFLVHRWQPSSTAGQIADIQIELRQHGEGPLTQGLVKCVEYHLGPRFARHTLVQSNREENFRLEVSAYGPFLCLARVVLDDGSEPVELERYIDF
jgi:hypothetical protein